MTTDYIYFDGQPLAEYNPATGDWSDYIYAGGRRIVKADSYENGIMIQGTNDGSSSWPNTWFQLNDANYLSGYTIQTGDHLYMRQYQDNARGGMGLFFRDGTNTAWQSTDQYGNYMNDDPNQLAWDEHSFDLTAFAGEVVDWVGIDTDAHTPPGAWTVVYGDIAIVSADGTVRPIYSASANFSVSLQWATGSTGVSVTNRHLSNIGWTPFTTTNYYTPDHLGSARAIFSFWGYPTWSGTFLPFGEEWNPEATVNHYKFTGKERDSESGLDDFGARYYTSTYGRFISADWSAIPEPVPYTNLSNPQTLNLYAIVHDNPETFADLDGHQGATGGGQPAAASVQPDCAQATDPKVCTVNPIDQKNLVTTSQMNQSTNWERTKAGDTENRVPPGNALPPSMQPPSLPAIAYRYTEFNSLDQAGIESINRINPTSIKEDTEYAGWIVKNIDGTFSINHANRGTFDGSDPGTKPANAAADYHTHGGNDRGYDNENFSPRDKQNVIHSPMKYLGTPLGAVKRYNSSTGQTTRLVRGSEP